MKADSTSPKGPCSYIVYTLGPKGFPERYFKLHGPWGIKPRTPSFRQVAECCLGPGATLPGSRPFRNNFALWFRV